MIKFLMCLAICSPVVMNPISLRAEVSNEDVKGFISKMNDIALPILTSEESLSSKSSKLKNILDEYFDVAAIAKFVMGTYWKQANSDQQQRFVTLFEKLLTNVYSERFMDFKGAKSKVISVKKEGKAYMVNCSVASPSKEPISIAWKVFSTKKGLRVYDLYVENASMGISQREEFTGVLGQLSSDIEAFLKKLENQISGKDKDLDKVVIR